MRIVFVITIVGMFGSAAAACGQTDEREPARSTRQFLERELSDSAFRSHPCVSTGSGDCTGGVLVVRNFKLTESARSRDPVRYVVELQVVGIIGVSEAAPFFMPRSWVDTTQMLAIRRKGRWTARRASTRSDENVRTTANVVRGFFDLDAEDRRLLDIAVGTK